MKRHNAKGSWRRWLLIAAALAAVVAAASHLGPGVHSSARSALEQASATLLGAVQTAPLQLPPTRRLIADTPWYSNASSALQAFKSGLFGAVERAYHDIEAAAYQADAAKPIERCGSKTCGIEWGGVSRNVCVSPAIRLNYVPRPQVGACQLPPLGPLQPAGALP